MRFSISFLFLALLTIGCAPESNPYTPATGGEAADPRSSSENMTGGESAAELRHEDLDAVLWIQSSGEYKAIAQQSFRMAAIVLDVAAADKKWTASKEQTELVASGKIRIQNLRPAVIVDVDETVLDNSRYQVGLIDAGKEFSPKSWETFCKSKVSTAVPGAADYVKLCRSKGIRVFYVTNREANVEQSTRENLIAVGLLDAADKVDTILTKNEKPDWKSSKVKRRLELAKNYRILQIVGDDLHDFAETGSKPKPDARQKFADDNSAYWGTKWIVLPNPNYGGWERSAHGWNDQAEPETKLELKRKQLKRGKN